jgi:hypothetical protein
MMNASLFATQKPTALMSSAQPPNPPANNDNGKKPEISVPTSATPAAGDAAMDTAPDVPPPENWDDIPEEILSLSTDEILTRIRLIENDIKVSYQLLLLAHSLISEGDEIGDPTAAT